MPRPCKAPLRFLIAAIAIGSAAAAPLAGSEHAASLRLRHVALKKRFAKDTCWPGGMWGDNLWTLAALRLNEKTDQANARLLKGANEYIETNRKDGGIASPTPENQDGAPWTFFSITNYVHTLCMFHPEKPLKVDADKVDHRFGGNRIEMSRYDSRTRGKFTLPAINGKPVNLHPEAVYENPFLNGKTGNDTFTVTVGPLKRVLGFSGSGE